jgi:aminopeptidase YwaD
MSPNIQERISMTRILACLVLSAIVGWSVPALVPVAAQTQALPQASSATALQHVTVLSQQIGPRPTGSPADVRTATYLAEQFQRLGYTVQRQSFPILFFDEAAPPTVNIVGQQAAALHALALIYSAATTADGLETEVVDAGLGREEDFRGKRLEGKIALVQRGEVFFRVKVANAAAAGASAVIVYNNRPGPPQAATLIEPSKVPAVMISQDDGERLAQLLRAGSVRVRLNVSTIVEQRMSQNIIGIKRGTRTPNEIVVVGGHADSVKQSPGANDNASGTAAVLEAARLLAQTPTARTIHFIGFGAEEIGLVGSRFYVQNRTGTIVGMVNMDMVGRGPMQVGNSGGDTSILDLAERVAGRLDIRVSTFRLREAASDHSSFEQAGIPAVFIHTGDDEAIHTPADVLARVNPQLVAQAATLAAGIARELATR